MTQIDPVLGDDELRWLDVLLEEEVLAAAGTRRAVAARHHWLRAVAALLGIAIVVATSWLVARTGSPAPAAPPQDPVRALREIPFDKALLPGVSGVRIRFARVVDETGSAFEDPRVIRADIREPKAVASWRDAIASCTPLGAFPHVHSYAVELDLGDGTMMVGFTDRSCNLRFAFLGFAASEAFRAVLLSELDAIDLRQRLALGMAGSLPELRALPTSRRSVVCRNLTATEVRSEFARFPQLEKVEFDDSSANHPRRFQGADERELPADDLALGLADVKSLRSVTLHARFLHADGLRALATLPQLRSLSIFGDAGHVPARELGELAGRLEALRLLDGEPTATQLQAISTSQRLHEFWFQCGPDFAPAGECLRALPRLQRLSLQPYGSLHVNEAIAAIAHTHVTELRLAKVTVTGRDLSPLVALASLATLHLEAVVGTSGLEHFPRLPQLRHLWTDASNYLLGGLRESLPNGTVHKNDGVDDWVSPFAPPRW